MPSDEQFSFCETHAALVWHIRRLSSRGRLLSGGADTPTLCWVPAAWDLAFDIRNLDAVKHICADCRAQYRDLQSE